jgi:hypothetical protein
MRSILMACGLVAIGVVQLGAQTPAVRQLPPATVARIRVEAGRLRQMRAEGRPAFAIQGPQARRAAVPAGPGAVASNAPFHERPPKSRP